MKINKKMRKKKKQNKIIKINLRYRQEKKEYNIFNLIIGIK